MKKYFLLILFCSFSLLIGMSEKEVSLVGKYRKVSDRLPFSKSEKAECFSFLKNIVTFFKKNIDFSSKKEEGLTNFELINKDLNEFPEVFYYASFYVGINELKGK